MCLKCSWILWHRFYCSLNHHIRLMYLKTWLQLDKVLTFSTRRCYRPSCVSYVSEILSKRSSDISGTCISLILMKNSFMKKQVWRNTYLKLRIRAKFITVKRSQKIQFVYTEVYSIFTTEGGRKLHKFLTTHSLQFFYNFTFSFKGLFSILFLLLVVFFDIHLVDQEFSQTFSIATWFGPLAIA